jgi:acyl carrier protein
MVFEKLQDIIVEELGVDKSEVTIDASISEDLGADSLDAVELVMAIEEEFDISVSDEVAQKFSTVREIVEFIENEK